MFPEKIEIRNDEDLFEAINVVQAQAEAQPDRAPPKIEFIDWPRFEITIRGEKFDGGVPTRIMPALMDLQREINRAYAVIHYGEERRLSKEERRQTEVVVRFKEGSTIFRADLYQILNQLAQQALTKMDGTQITIIILSTAAIVGGYAALKVWLNARLQEKGYDHQLAMSHEETRRHETLAQLAEENQQVRQELERFRGVQSEFARKLQDDEVLDLGSGAKIDGETARKATRKPRSQPVEDRLDGYFTILTVDSGAVEGGYRLRIRKQDDQQELTVDVPQGTLNAEQTNALQRGEWGKTPIFMQINVKRTDDEIREATLTRAGLQEDS